MVQASRLKEIHQAWVDRGSPLCRHEGSEKEYDLGAQTGDLGCLVCGETWWSGEKPAPAGG